MMSVQFLGRIQTADLRFTCSVNTGAGDSLVVWRLDHFGVAPQNLIQFAGVLAERDIGFRRLHDSIDNNSSGRLIFDTCGAFAEFDVMRLRFMQLATLAGVT